MRTRTALLALVALTVGACAGNSGPQQPRTSGDTDWAEVQVDNETPHALRLFAMRGSAEISLGRVDPLSSERLRMPRSGSPVVRLVARPSVDLQNGRAHVSEPISIFPGQLITWQLRASPGLSDLPRMSTVRVSACTTADCR